MTMRMIMIMRREEEWIMSADSGWMMKWVNASRGRRRRMEWNAAAADEAAF